MQPQGLVNPPPVGAVALQRPITPASSAVPVDTNKTNVEKFAVKARVIKPHIRIGP